MRALLAAALLWTAAPAGAGSFHVGLGNAVAAEGAKVVNKAANNLPSCGGSFQLFTMAPVTDANLKNIAPMGSQSDHILPPDHMYFNYVTENNPNQKLFAPANGWVTQVTQENYDNNTTMYFIAFQPCQEVALNFLLIPTISAALQAGLSAPGASTSCSAFGSGDPSSSGTGCVTNMKVAVNAGDVLGLGAIEDFGPLQDTRVQLQGFANPSRHTLDRGFCPLNYFAPGALPASQYATGEFNGTTTVPRTAQPLCGTIVDDSTGTALGDWYNPTSPESQDASYAYEAEQMSLVHEVVYTSTDVFSVGTTVNQFGGVFQGKDYFAPKFTADGSRIDYDFGLVKDNQIYCYDTFTNTPLFGSSAITNLNGFIVLLQLTGTANGTLTLDVQDPGTNCATVGAANWAMSPSAVTFER